MKRRTPILATILAAVIATLTLAPAQATPAAPVLTTPDAGVAGQVSSTATTDQAFVLAGISTDTSTWQSFAVTAGSASISLPTWGYSGTTTLHAVACPSGTYDATACSPEATTDNTFTPTDVSPQVTWFSPDTVGPGQSAPVTVTDTGGGTLQAVWDNTEGTPITTQLAQNGTTDLTLADGTGTVTLERCSTVDTSACTGFTPAITQPLTVRTTATASLGTVASITTANPTSSATVGTNRAGTYSLSWHLEQKGTPVSGGPTGTGVTGSLDVNGAAAPFSIDGNGLADGGYDIVGTITVTDPSFGTFPAAAFSGTVTVASGAPLVTAVDTTTPGHVTGTVSSLRPYVYVWFDASAPATLVPLTSGSGTFDLPTWGYSGSQMVHAIACPTTANDATCSVEQAVAFTPTDVTPQVTWFSDSTVGPTQSATIDVTDTGGGTLQAIWDNTEGTPVTTLLNQSGTTDLNLADGTGTVTIVRCSLVVTTTCTGFTPAITHTLTVRTVVPTSVGAIARITTPHPSTTAGVTTKMTGTYTLTWHLEQGGVPVSGGPTGSVNTPTALNANGTTPAFPIAGTGLADGTYDLVGTITVTDPDFSTNPFPAAAFTGSLIVHKTGPVVTITSSMGTIYPNVNNSVRPGSTLLTVAGAGLPAVRTFKIANGSTVIRLTLNAGGQVTWYGRGSGASTGTLAAAGTYTATAYDSDGNPSAAHATVVLSTKHWVLVTWRKTVSAQGSLINKYVGACSTLRRPSLRRWAGSLGFYSDTRCNATTWTRSAVSTVQGVFLPPADKYVDVHVDTYGGAATTSSLSVAIVRYLTTGGVWVSQRTLRPAVGWRVGLTRSLSGMVFKDRSFGWGVATGYGNKFDVRSFTVVARYYTLG
jgi:hypothetical protein